MRLKENLKISRHTEDDIVFTLHTKGLPDIPIRVIRVELSSGVIEYLATNLMDSSISPVEFKWLYFQRWKVESKYNEIKNEFLLEEFNGATKISIEQEIFITLLLSNLCALIKSEADQNIQQNANPKNKYQYQANRSFIIGKIKRLFPKLLSRNKIWPILISLLQEASRNRSQLQPGRSRPRKRRPKERIHFQNKKVVI